MANPMYDTATLIQVINNLKVSQKFLLDRFFPAIVTSDTEYVAIDVEIGARRMAPFVSPLVEGKVMQQLGAKTNLFKPAYVKPKTPLDVRAPVRRQIGERIGGDLTAAQRAEANVVKALNDHIDQIDRRCEWMGASALATGTVTITGDGFPTVVVDFGRDPALTIAKAGGAKWTAANITAGTASPSADIEAWGTLMLKKSGAVANDIVFTPGSWAGFVKDPALDGAIIYPKFSESGNVINVGAQIQLGGQYKGKWGQYDLWLYNDWFIDDNGVEQPMLADGLVIMGGAAVMGTRNFGLILDPKFNYQPMPYAPKIWTVEDPAQTLAMTQSAPIMVPGRPNASLSAMVV